MSSARSNVLAGPRTGVSERKARTAVERDHNEETKPRKDSAQGGRVGRVANGVVVCSARLQVGHVYVVDEAGRAAAAMRVVGHERTGEKSDMEHDNVSGLWLINSL